MKSVQKKRSERPLRKEYDFRTAVVGKYAKQYAEGTNVILLDADMAAAFPDSKSVNEALRSLVRASAKVKTPK